MVGVRVRLPYIRGCSPILRARKRTQIKLATDQQEVEQVNWSAQL
jgi:hypothetical protein